MLEQRFEGQRRGLEWLEQSFRCVRAEVSRGQKC